MHRHTLLVLTLAFSLTGVTGMAAAQCGDGVIQAGEDCDDGGLCIGGMNAGVHCTAESDCIGTGVCLGGTRSETVCNQDVDCFGGICRHCVPVGGDGCAANCTNETDLPANLVPGTSGSAQPAGSRATVYAEIIPEIPVPLRGTEVLTVGKPRNGELPVVIKGGGTQLPRIDVSGLACACVRGVPEKTCGGTLFEADGSLSTECTPVFTSGDSICNGTKPCSFVYGVDNVAAGVIGCSGLAGTSASTTQDSLGSQESLLCTETPGLGVPACAAPPVVSLTDAGPGGAARIFQTLAVGTVIGSCSNSPTFCSDTDPLSDRGTPVTVPMVTGTASAAMFNINGEDGVNLGPFSQTGHVFSCDAAVTGNFSGAALAGAYTAPNLSTVQDAVATLLLAFETNQAATPTPTPFFSGPAVLLGSANGAPGQQVAVAATLSSGGNSVAGVQADITFDLSTHIAALPDGTPNCTVNPAIQKEETAFAFQPFGCSGTACTGVRAVVISFTNTTSIDNGAQLFTCTITIEPTAIAGLHPLTVSNVAMSTPFGQPVSGASGINGSVNVSGNGGATPTPTPFIFGPAVFVGTANGAPGQQVPVAATLQTGGAEVAGVQVDIAFDPATRVNARPNGKPDCSVNPDIQKAATAFVFQPSGCSGTGCTGVRGVVFATDNTLPIANGAQLFTCTINIDPTAAAGVHPLTASNVAMSTPVGALVPGATGVNGSISVSGGGVPTGTPVIVLENASGQPGQLITFAAALHTNGASVAGLQNDITFSSSAAIATRFDGSPDCTVNPAIGKDATAFGFLPFGGIRVIVFSLQDNNPLPDGAQLYTCRVTISPFAPPGQYPLSISNVIMSTPLGQPVAAAGVSGSVNVLTGGVTPTPTFSAGGVVVSLENTSGAPGQAVTVVATLRTGGAGVAGVQNDISFDPTSLSIASRQACASNNSFACTSGAECAPGDTCVLVPDCMVNPAINKEATAFGFLPPGCVGTGCNGIRALVFSLQNTLPISDGAQLYSCTFDINPGTTPGPYPLVIDGVFASDPEGNDVPTTGLNGLIAVAEPPTPTIPVPPTNTSPPFTATRPPFTATPLPTNTATRPPFTATAPPTNTATPPPLTATPQPTDTATPPPFTPTAQPTRTSTPLPTATPTPEASTPADGNCDGAFSAADLISVLRGLQGPILQCTGVDANQDGRVSSADLSIVVHRIFDPQS